MNKAKHLLIKALRTLPARVRNSLLHVAFNVAPDEFAKFAYLYAFAPHMEYGLAALRDLGFLPATVIDVGAFEGRWSKVASQLWPKSKLILFEPNTAQLSQLRATADNIGAQLYTELLGASDGQEVLFYVMESGSSVMSERSPLPRTSEVRRLRRLDSILADIASPALLKIDAQGYELQILIGAAGLLQRLEAVLLEVSLIEINKGAPLLHDVVAFMKERGFVSYDILEIHRRPLDRALNQIDVLFVKENSALISDKRHFA